MSMTANTDRPVPHLKGAPPTAPGAAVPPAAKKPPAPAPKPHKPPAPGKQGDHRAVRRHEMRGFDGPMMLVILGGGAILLGAANPLTKSRPTGEGRLSNSRNVRFRWF